MLAALLGLGASGCIDAILIEEQQQPASARDAGVQLEADGSTALPDADTPQEPGAELDAGTPGGAEDAGRPPMLDGGRDGGREAGPAPRDASTNQDAGCEGGQCDAGPVVLGPCGSCGVIVLVQPADFTDPARCDNGAPKPCWSNPVGECTYQCPNTPSCTRDDLGSCGPGHYCYFPKSDCGAGSAGFCAPAPKECMADLPSRVCGCDGVIYQNPCFAAQAGVGAFVGSPEAFCK